MINSVNTSSPLICIDGTAQIDATASLGNGAPYTYTWTDLSTGNPILGNGPHSVSPVISPTCYSVFATDPLGCISSPSQVCIDLYPSIIASTPSGTIYDTLTVCSGNSSGGPFGTDIEMSAIGGMGAPFTYTWYDNGAQIGANNSGVINVTPSSSPTTYIGVATDDCTTPGDSVFVTVKWFDEIVPDFSRNKPDSCYPFTVEFTNTSTPAALISSSEWDFSDGTSLVGNPVSNLFSTPVCRDLTLTVTTTDGCIFIVDSVDYVCPHDYPDANFSMNPPETDLLNTQIDFTNLSDGVEPLSYLWNFNSGLFPDTSAVTHPTFTFPEDTVGNYDILLTVTDGNGCVSTVPGTVIINGIYLFYMPNSFTPDGDGLNDVFRPYGEGMDVGSYTMQVFNRWGELIFESSNGERGWNGTYRGKKVPTGSYAWKVTVKEEFTPIRREHYGYVNVLK
jgi:gliding motility-associated-like protein